MDKGMKAKDDWRNPFAPSWVRVSPLRPFWEQNVQHNDPSWVKKSPFLGPNRERGEDENPS
jgi:hypothetical protein